MTQVDWVVVGAGVVGAAIAERFSRTRPSDRILILEKESGIGQGITSRNSGVIHAGIYYPKNSLKSLTCLRGIELLYSWCNRNAVPHRNCGKVIVATDESEQEALDELFRHAIDCGATGLSRVGFSEIAKIEPNASGREAIYSSRTGIVDAEAFAKSLIQAAESQGDVEVLTNAGLSSIEVLSDGYLLNTTRGPVTTKGVVNAAGLESAKVAAMAGMNGYRIYPWRGDYFALRGSYRFERLVYPVKKKSSAGLGVHVTVDLGGRIRLGPDVELVANADDHSPREDKRQKFFEAAGKLIPGLRLEDLYWDMAGIRPKLRGPGDTEEKDFVISMDLPGFINLVGIESPGLTAAMAIAERIEGMI